MRKKPEDTFPVPIKLSEVERLSQSGYEPLTMCDASKANSDWFLVLVKRHKDGTRDYKILCPTFLRGPLGFAGVKGAVSY